MAAKKIKRTKEPGEGPKAPDLLAEVADDLGFAETLDELTRGDLDPEKLTHGDRRILLMLAKRDRSQVQLARLFGVSRRTIQKDLDAIKREVARTIDPDEIVGNLVMVSERCSAQALDQGDPGTAWKIAKELVEVLQELGCIGPPRREAVMGLTVETLSAGYERAREALAKAMDPRLTGEVVPEDDPALKDIRS